MIEDKDGLAENSRALVAIDGMAASSNISTIISMLRLDKVVVLRSLGEFEADRVISKIADALGLHESLEMQAAFASLHGHRKTVGQYFMTVNQRDGFQFIPPHSEGGSAVGIQIASFFCYKNNTDGGETILFHVNPESSAWPFLRERVTRVKLTTPQLTARDLAQARMRYKVDTSTDLLRGSDKVLAERATDLPGLMLVDALAEPQKVYSHILGRDMFSYWDSIASLDFSSAYQYMAIMKDSRLLKEPPGGFDLSRMDNAFSRRLFRTSISYGEIFDCKIIYKLSAGDLIIFNNMTWAHAANNWSPCSGTRQVAAAFA